MGTFPMPVFAPAQSGGNPGSDMVSAGSFNYSPPGGGQNQWMNYPALNSPGNNLNPVLFGGSGGSGGYPLPMTAGGAQQTNNIPGIVPPAPSQAPPLSSRTNPGDTASAGVGARLPGQAYQGRTIDPQLTEQLASYLMGQLGQGLTPFDLSALLPSTGQATAPGTLTAPENPILQSLQQFYTSGTGGPLPGVLPMWQSELQSMNIPIQQQLANIKEQFGARGALGSTELATALENYGSQTAADQESLLGQLTLQALPGMEQFGGALQNLDQQSINNLYQEFQRTQPQNNPLFQDIFGMGNEFPPIYSNKKGPLAEAFMSSLGQSLGTFGLSAGGGNPASFSLGGG